jgi:hypothetical protein
MRKEEEVLQKIQEEIGALQEVSENLIFSNLV